MGFTFLRAGKFDFLLKLLNIHKSVQNRSKQCKINRPQYFYFPSHSQQCNMWLLLSLSPSLSLSLFLSLTHPLPWNAMQLFGKQSLQWTVLIQLSTVVSMKTANFLHLTSCSLVPMFLALLGISFAIWGLTSLQSICKFLPDHMTDRHTNSNAVHISCELPSVFSVHVC